MTRTLIACAALVTVSLSARADDISDAPETSQQKDFRLAYVKRTTDRIHELTDAKARTEDENKVIADHWRRAMRAIRVREVMQDENDRPTVARVDAFLNHLDEHTYARLGALAKAAPDKPKAPVVETPKTGTKVKMNETVVVRMSAYPDAKVYGAYVQQGQHQVWFGGSAKTRDTHAVNVNLEKFAQTFQAGPAKLKAIVLVDKHWSDYAIEDIVLEGSDAPQPAGELAAPTLLSPAHGTKLSLASPTFTCKFEPYPGATEYECRVNQNGGGWTKCTSSNPEFSCKLVDKTKAGQGTVYGAVVVGGKTSHMTKGFNVDIKAGDK